MSIPASLAEANRQQEPAVSNQPDQPNPYAGTTPGHDPFGQTPAGQEPEYTVPEYVGQPAAAGQPPAGTGQPVYGQNPYGENPRGQNPQGPNPYGQNLQGQDPRGQNPYGQNPQGQSPYGAPATGTFAQPQYGAPSYHPGGAGYADSSSGPRGLSLASMIIGLVSLFLAGMLIVPQIVGIVLGHVALAKESPQGRPFSITGLITSYLALLIYLGIYAIFIYFAASYRDYSTVTGSSFSSLLSKA